MRRFSERRFRMLRPQQQHKKAAEALRKFYEGGDKESRAEYGRLASWLALGECDLSSAEECSNRYHWHLTRAKVNLTEPGLLPKVQKGDRPKAAQPLPLHFYLEHIRSAHNVGSILRSAEAFSLGTVFFSDQTPPPQHPQVRKTSMGTAEWVDTCVVGGLQELPRPLIVVETCPEAQDLHSFNFPEECTIAFGNEEIGCSEALLAEADFVIKIPLFGRKNSLNVANCVAIVASEFRRQHQEKAGEN